MENYNNILQSLEDKKEYLEEVKKYGVRHESASFIEYHQSTNTDYTTEFEKKEILINQIEKQIKTAEYTIFLIQKCMDRFKEKDPYWEIIERRYFKKENIADITFNMGIAEKTYYKNRKRLIEEFAAALFVSDYLKELFSDMP